MGAWGQKAVGGVMFELMIKNPDHCQHSTALKGALIPYQVSSFLPKVHNLNRIRRKQSDPNGGMVYKAAVLKASASLL